MRAIPILLACAACSGTDPAPPSARAVLALGAPAAGPADVVVATVDGRPVWGSCVAAQARRGDRTRDLDRQAALRECIDFELMAQAAERAGLAADRELGEEARRALVSRLVERDFEDRYQKPDDLRELVDRVVERNRDQLDKPELRASSFVRVEVAANAPPEEDRRARALAERIGGELANETGLFPIHLRETAQRLAAGTGLKVTDGDFRAAAPEALVTPYADALFAIREVGRIGKPARTQWGWDVILLTELLPPKVYTREEVAASVFPGLRRTYFQMWVNQIIQASGVRIEIDKEHVSRLDQLGDRR